MDGETLDLDGDDKDHFQDFSDVNFNPADNDSSGIRAPDRT